MFMDQAGWHTTKKLALPDNITIDFLPPRSPQCNPQEPVWKVLRRDILGNRHFNSLAEVSKATAGRPSRLGKQSSLPPRPLWF